MRQAGNIVAESRVWFCQHFVYIAQKGPGEVQLFFSGSPNAQGGAALRQSLDKRVGACMNAFCFLRAEIGADEKSRHLLFAAIDV